MSRNSRSVFLDVDPSIIENNVMVQRGSRLEEDMKQFLTRGNPAAKLVKPNPGFCIKARLKNEDKKIFINICQTDVIPPPKDLSEEELVEILSSDEPSGYRVPMSIGEPRTEIDNSNQPASVYDIAISTEFFNRIKKSTVFHSFFMSVVFEGLQDKYQFEMDTDNIIILKNRKSVGTLQSHRIQLKDVKHCKDKSYAPIIEEMKSNPANIKEPRKPTKKQTLADKKRENLTEMAYQIVRVPKTGKIEYMVGEFKLDRTMSSNDVTLDVGEDRIIVETRKTNQLVDIFVPFTIKQGTAKAVLNRNTSVLTVTMAACDPV